MQRHVLRLERRAHAVAEDFWQGKQTNHAIRRSLKQHGGQYDGDHESQRNTLNYVN